MNEQPPSNEPSPMPAPDEAPTAPLTQPPTQAPEAWPTQSWQAQSWHVPPVDQPVSPSPGRPRMALRYTSIAVAAAVASGLATVAFEHSPAVHTTGVVNANNGTSMDGGTLDGGSSGLPSMPFDQMNPYSGTVPGYGTVPNYGSGRHRFGGGTSNPQSNGSSQSATAAATTAQQVGVVDINTVLDYGTGKAAGTGLVLSSDGEILTNNHVIASATSIKVTVVSTGTTYTARVVGTDVTQDIAVLQLQSASGLTRAHLGNSSAVAVGDAVTGVGNAGGTGGTPSAAAGHVRALDQSITAQDEAGGGERLNGLIETDAAIRAGDSGGPLFDAKDQVIGLDTAASSGGAAEGYAIPINTAVSIATQIEQGVTSSTITQGYPAFLGVQLSSQSAAPVVAGVVADSAAAKAGLANGDTITKVDGTSITTATQLQSVIASKHPGDNVRLTWTDASGSTHNATVALGEGPAQ